MGIMPVAASVQESCSASFGCLMMPVALAEQHAECGTGASGHFPETPRGLVFQIIALS